RLQSVDGAHRGLAAWSTYSRELSCLSSPTLVGFVPPCRNVDGPTLVENDQTRIQNHTSDSSHDFVTAPHGEVDWGSPYGGWREGEPPDAAPARYLVGSADRGGEGGGGEGG